MLELNFKINWNYKGQKGKETLFHTAIGSFQTGLRDWSPAFRAMVDEVLAPEVQAMFDTKGHGTWSELTASTIRRKGHATILIETGEMMTSFRRGAPGNVEDITRSALKWGTSLQRALFHQTGTMAGFQRLYKELGLPGVPMRKILSLTSEAKRKMQSLMVQRLATISRREGFAVAKGIGLDALSARKIGEQLLEL